MESLQVGDLIRVVESHWGLSANGKTLIVEAIPGQPWDDEGRLVLQGEVSARFLDPSTMWGTGRVIVNHSRVEKL